MARNSSQSPQAKRGSAQDSEKFTKGEVPKEFARDVGKAPARENERAYDLLDNPVDNREGGWPPGA